MPTYRYQLGVFANCSTDYDAAYPERWKCVRELLLKKKEPRKTLLQLQHKANSSQGRQPKVSMAI